MPVNEAGKLGCVVAVRSSTISRVRILFARDQRGESLTTVYRTDGVVVELPSYSRKHRVPHDLAHAVAERELGLAGGVFGSIAAGALFENMRVIGGRTRHDAAARSRRILAANRRTLTLAEAMAGALHHLVEHADASPSGTSDASPADSVSVASALRRAWDSLNQEPFPYPPQQVIAAARVLRDHADRWATLHHGETLEFRWPDTLTAPVPPATTRRGRRRRS
jgi:hypothetical protein